MEKQQLFLDNKSSGLPGPNEFILGNAPGTGGWGAWTISRLVGGFDASKSPLQHSFGLLGVEFADGGLDSTTGITKGWVKTWQTDGQTETLGV